MLVTAGTASSLVVAVVVVTVEKGGDFIAVTVVVATIEEGKESSCE